MVNVFCILRKHFIMKRLLFFLIVLLITKSAQADVWMTQIDSCGILSATISTPITTTACEGDSIELSATVYSNVTAQWYKDGIPFGMPNASTVYALQNGVYHLEVTNSLLQCNYSFENIGVQINPLPIVYAGPDVTVCDGGVWYFYADGDGINYFWSNGLPNGSPSTILESGVVTLLGIDGNGCSNSDTLIVTVLPNIVTFYDGDGDGFGTPSWYYESCFQPNNFVMNSSDCNDNNASINPNASEICSGQDENCNGLIDDGFILSDYYLDFDIDGFGNPNLVSHSCFQPLGYVSNGTDCNDNDFMVNTNALEICNDVDDNCNGLVDDGLVFTNYYVDFDLDGFGSSNTMQSACYQPVGFVANALDCNDASFCINAAAIEICNGLDDDCNGVADNGIVFATFYADADGDTYGDPATGQDFCLIPDGMFVDNGNDCDDSNALVNPLAVEIWENGIDDDCNPATSDVSVEELIALEYTLYPNPVENQLTISFIKSDLGSVFIYNSVGMLVASLNPNDSTLVVDMSQWSAGFYMVRFGQLNRTIIKR